MPRIVSVWLPAWPLDRLARALRRTGQALPWVRASGREMPFALVESGVHGLGLSAVNAAAWREGARPGQTLADARAAFPALKSRPAEPDLDARALEGLALWAGRYGPRRNTQGADGVWIDVSGVAHLFGGEARLLEDLLSRMQAAGIGARAALADTHGGAFALARFSSSSDAPFRIAGEGATRDAIAHLPVEALRLPADAAVLLHRLGLSRIGQLYALPRQSLAQRFRSGLASRAKLSGKRERQASLMAGVVLARLDQALGLVPEPCASLEEPPCHIARLPFAEPLISAAGVEAALERLALDLSAMLEARHEGGTRFTLALYRADGSAQQVRVGASRPCRDPRHIVGLLSEKLETLDAGYGIDVMTLACSQVEPLAVRQIGLAGAGIIAAEAGTSVLMDRLANRLGPARVFRIAGADSHIPERAQQRIPVLCEMPDTAFLDSAPKLLRPAFLLPNPEPITVLAEVPEGPPLRFTWRRLVCRVVRARGPERIEPEWWRAIGVSQKSCFAQDRQLGRPRDYYRVEDDQGGRFWLFRAGLYGRGEEEECEAADACSTELADQEGGARSDPVWFMHGVFG